LRAGAVWTGLIVFAGGTPHQGGSLDAERELLGRHPELEERFVNLGSVSGAERKWL
jgi:hypothetical protein